jgi:hypothetical protein
MRPETMIDMADAIHVERVQKDLFLAHGRPRDGLWVEAAIDLRRRMRRSTWRMMFARREAGWLGSHDHAV